MPLIHWRLFANFLISRALKLPIFRRFQIFLLARFLLEFSRFSPRGRSILGVKIKVLIEISQILQQFVFFWLLQYFVVHLNLAIFL